MAKRALHASDTQTAKHIAQSAIHAHEGSKVFMPRNLFTIASDGADDAGKGVLLDATGLIDESVLDESIIDHDLLLNYVVNKHIDHSGVSISTSTGLTGGGDITSTRTLSLSHLGLENLTDPGSNKLMYWDDTSNYVTWAGVGTGLSLSSAQLDLDLGNINHDGLQNFVSNEHIDYTSAIDNTNYCVKCDTRVHAWLGTTMSNLTDNTWTLVQMDTEVFDDGNDFNTSTYLFTAPVTGYYFITATVGFNNVVANTPYDIQIDKNSGTMLTSFTNQVGNVISQVAGIVTGIFKLTATDTIGIKARSRSGDNTVDILGGASGYTNVCIILLAT